MKNLRRLVASLAVMGIMISPLTTNARTVDEITAQINSLLAAIAQLQSELNTINSSNTSNTPSTVNSVPSVSPSSPSYKKCTEINRFLRRGVKDTNSNKDVTVLQEFLISEGYLNEEATGFFGVSTDKALKEYQKNEGIVSSGTALSTGYGATGPMTRNKIKIDSCGGGEIIIVPPTPAGQISIVSMQGPNSLVQGQVGTWKINVNAPVGTNLVYSAVWGDENQSHQGVYVERGRSVVYTTNTEATFTHAYGYDGNFTAKFKISDANGKLKEAVTTISVLIGNTVVQSAVTVVSPNGGETLMLGQSQIIKWKSVPTPVLCAQDALCDSSVQKYDIKLVPSNVCPDNMFCAQYISLPFVIVTGVNGPEYKWEIGSLSGKGTVTEGDYKIQVCRSGTDVCDTSDSYFKIFKNPYPSAVIFPSAGSVLTQGSTYKILWSGWDYYRGDKVTSYALYLVGGSLGSTGSRYIGAINMEMQDWFSWTVPSDITAGSGYRIQFSGAGATGANSGSFSIVAPTSPIAYDKFDFNCDRYINQTDADIIINLWKSGTKVDMSYMTREMAKCRPLGEWLAPVWREQNGYVSVSYFTKTIHDMIAAGYSVIFTGSQPYISSLSQSTVNSESYLSILGRNLANGINSYISVTVGNQPATIIKNDDMAITVKMPRLDPGTYSVVVKSVQNGDSNSFPVTVIKEIIN